LKDGYAINSDSWSEESRIMQSINFN